MSHIWVQRAEGAVFFFLSLWVYTTMGANWWLFAFLILVPDISMLGYFIDPKWGARIYNFAHGYFVPLFLGIFGYLLNDVMFMQLCVIWFAHISIDRALGFGLKLPSGFKDTHLGKL